MEKRRINGALDASLRHEGWLDRLDVSGADSADGRTIDWQEDNRDDVEATTPLPRQGQCNHSEDTWDTASPLWVCQAARHLASQPRLVLLSTCWRRRRSVGLSTTTLGHSSTTPTTSGAQYHLFRWTTLLGTLPRRPAWCFYPSVDDDDNNARLDRSIQLSSTTLGHGSTTPTTSEAQWHLFRWTRLLSL